MKERNVFQVLRDIGEQSDAPWTKTEWVSLWHAYANEADWQLLCEAADWIGPVRMLDASGLAVREFHPAPEATCSAHELIVDNFAGGGGASTGIELASSGATATPSSSGSSVRVTTARRRRASGSS